MPGGYYDSSNIQNEFVFYDSQQYLHIFEEYYYLLLGISEDAFNSND